MQPSSRQPSTQPSSQRYPQSSRQPTLGFHLPSQTSSSQPTSRPLSSRVLSHRGRTNVAHNHRGDQPLAIPDIIVASPLARRHRRSPLPAHFPAIVDAAAHLPAVIGLAKLPTNEAEPTLPHIEATNVGPPLGSRHHRRSPLPAHFPVIVDAAAHLPAEFSVIGLAK